MMKWIIWINLFISWAAFAQTRSVKVMEEKSRFPINGASVSIFGSGNRRGALSNEDGYVSFSLSYVDSVRFACVGFQTQTFYAPFLKLPAEIYLKSIPVELKEVVIKPLNASQLVKTAIKQLPVWFGQSPFETRGFYREIIKDNQHYFSVSEAIFDGNYWPAKKLVKLKLVRGRSKEDVDATRLFEGFHPGGGPQWVSSQHLSINKPSFLDEKQLNKYVFQVDSLVQLEEKWMYVISFDQAPNLKESLEKGRLFIRQDDNAIIRFESETSPRGFAYRKHLDFSDKLVAQLLKIELERTYTKKIVEFRQMGDQFGLHHVSVEEKLSYKQPKKSINLDLTIQMDYLATDFNPVIENPISKEEEWKRNQLIVNLPTAFDPAFWGDYTIITPSKRIDEVVASVATSSSIQYSPQGWQLLNPSLFLMMGSDSLWVLTPFMKSEWGDDSNAGLVYKLEKGDFEIETSLQLGKYSSEFQPPDNGFQQAGLMIRQPNSEGENYIFVALGTAGNSNPKLIVNHTINNRSAIHVKKIEQLDGWLKLVKQGNKVTCWVKSKNEPNYQRWQEKEAGWLTAPVQVGIAVQAHFEGNGPKMHPNLKATFTKLKIKPL